jgi:hypothetical protein
VSRRLSDEQDGTAPHHPHINPQAMTSPSALSLNATLAEFRHKANTHPRIPSLIRGWTPVIVVEASDTASKHYLPVKGEKIDVAEPGEFSTEHLVHLRAEEQTLISIFNGTSNPAEAFLNGSLEIFASDKDQIKLDAVSLVLWGA